MQKSINVRTYKNEGNLVSTLNSNPKFVKKTLSLTQYSILKRHFGMIKKSTPTKLPELRQNGSIIYSQLRHRKS